MIVTTISDTHSQHGLIPVDWLNINDPENSILIHAGDISNRGRPHEVLDFLTWFSSLPHKYKIFIAGNHDYYFDPKFQKNDIASVIPKNVIYLNDSGVEIEGIKIWGSPIQPWFYSWAFNRMRGEDIKKHWDLIPLDTDILITHGPPHLMGDKVLRGNEHVGCVDLMKKIIEIKPKYHIFGHIHEAAGVYKVEDTTFINASILNEDYVVTNKPVVFEIE